MKKLFPLFFLLHFFMGYSQIYDPVTWSTSVETVADGEYDLLITADIESGWHLYSQYVPENGPIPTSFSFQLTEGVELVGETTEGEGIETHDPIFDMQIKFFADRAEFRQRVQVVGGISAIKAKVEFMVCDDQKCLPPTSESLKFSLGGQEDDGTSETAATNPSDGTIVGSPAEGLSEEATEENASVVPAQPRAEESSSKGLFTIFFIAFLSGFAALLTPCVFPMIPMTVSYFTKQSKTRAKGISNAVIYGISIIVIYVLLGTLVTVVFGADSLNALSTSVWFNLIFFVLLVVFALSFLGAFELVLPSSWGTKIDSKADRGGFIGIFFMALALAIVSFSCTGPIVGTLLVEAASKGGLAPVVGMLGFSLAIALPFALFAAFPGWMNSLPKSGGWLNTVKVVLGFLELALAFKFLSNADLVLQTHFLEREVFITIWIAIFGMLALYLFGKVRLPHDSPSDHISVGRLSFGIFVLAFTIYLIPGLWGAPLKIISGFPPPMQYSESPEGVGFMRSSSAGPADSLPEGAKYGPHNIVSFLDYEEGMAYAKKANKPVLLDFTGHACVNCRKMEERVWAEPKVMEVLKNDVVLISLYVDDRRELPESEQYVSEVTGKKIETIGNKWSEFQIINYQANAQPYYVIISHEEENLNKPTGYDPDVNSYYEWLLRGIENFGTDS